MKDLHKKTLDNLQELTTLISTDSHNNGRVLTTIILDALNENTKINTDTGHQIERQPHEWFITNENKVI